MEQIYADLIPGGKMPLLHASQYDEGREYRINLTENKQAYTLDGSELLSISVRKGDNTLFTADIANTFGGKSYVDFVSTEQMCAVAGYNFGELTIEKNNTRIGTVNFMLVCEPSPEASGLASESEINNLNRQIDDYLDETLPDVLDDDVPPIVERVIDETLAPVAKSGSYNDLENKPTIPAAQVNSDWNADSGVSQILNKPNLATVATSGNYNDLYNKPSVAVIDDTQASASKVYSSEKVDEKLEVQADELVDIRIGADGTTYASAGDAVRGQVSRLDSETNSVFNTLVKEISYLSGKMYSLSNGNLTNNSTYTGTEKYFGSDAFSVVNFELSNIKDIIVFWNKGAYVGFFYKEKYYNPSSTEVVSLTYDEWAINKKSDSTADFYLTNLSRAFDEIDDLYDLTQPLVNDFKWTSGGYYNFTTGNISTSTGYWHTDKVKGNQFEFNNNSLFFSISQNFVSFWNTGTYVGYYLNGKYYNTSSTEVVSLTYDEWGANYFANSSDTTHNNIKPNSIEERLEKLENTSSRFAFLSSKSIGFLGDSITYGVGASDRTETSYVALMENEFGTVVNYGVSGTFIADEAGYSNAMVNRYSNMSDDLDIIVVFGGTNDWYYGTAWGTTDSTDTTTFLGALNVLMSGLVEKYCGKEIFFVTPMSSEYSNHNTDNQNACGKTMLDYRNAIIERATHFAIPVIDLYSMCNMDVAHNALNKTYYSSDGVHPNDVGHKRVHDRILTFIANILC